MSKVINYIEHNVSYAGDPHTYTKAKEGKNYYCYCNATQDRIDGQYKCNFRKREYELKKDIAEKIIHVCTYKKKVTGTERTISTYFHKENTDVLVNCSKQTDEITYEDILTKVAILVGKRNLSLEAGASIELLEIIKSAIRYGQQYSKAKIDDIFKKFSAYTVRKYLIAASIDINKEQFRVFSELKYVGVSCDEGTTRGVHDLDFVLENPLSGLKPYHCFTTVMNKGTATDYTEHLSRGLEFLRINKIPVGSITIDGNRAQLKALSFDWINSLRHRYIDHDDFSKHILVNPCLCHRINNAYKAAYRNSQDLQTVVKLISQIASEMKENIEIKDLINQEKYNDVATAIKKLEHKL